MTSGNGRNRASVLIVGAGPVGMVLALDLAQRGVKVAVVEKHDQSAVPVQRCNHISARTLEIFRQLGVASEIRDAGLPDDFPQDINYTTALNGYELARIRIPARKDRFGTTGYADSGWPTPEPPHRCNQMYFEPILQRHMLASPNIDVFYGTEIVNIDQNSQRVLAKGLVRQRGEEILLEADYLVGCDGGQSMVRKAIGAKFEGVNEISRTRCVLIRAPKLLDKLRNKPAWMTWFINPQIFGAVVALNGDDLWAFHMWLKPGSESFDTVDPLKAIPAAVGEDLEFEILAIDDWYGRRLVSDRLHDRRIFISGDAGHIWIPMAGYGMNAGIGDAMNLSWKLAGTINGWAGPNLLAAYEAERHPVVEQISRQVMDLAIKNLDDRFLVNPPPELFEDNAAGAATRAEVGRFLYETNVGQFAPLGLNFGAYYDSSPVIAYDGGVAPTYNMTTYHPSTVPGCRTPHIWLAGCVSLYDAMGADFALLRFDPSVEVTNILAAAKEINLPLKLVDIAPEEAGDIYDHKLIISRPDQHIAWRGDAEPQDIGGLLDVIRGA